MEISKCKCTVFFERLHIFVGKETPLTRNLLIKVGVTSLIILGKILNDRKYSTINHLNNKS